MGLLDRLLSRRPTRDAFAKLAAAVLEKSGASNLQYDPAEFSLRAGSVDRTFFLENAYSDYCHAQKDKDRQSCLARYVSSFLQTSVVPRDFASAKANLMPVVRDPAYYSLTLLKFQSDGKSTSNLDYATTPVAPGLLAALAFDSEHTIMSIDRSTLEGWGVDFGQALAIAVENLRDRTPASGFKQIASGLYISEFGDSYDSARLLLPDMFYRLALNGDPVIFAPNRNQLWVTGKYDAAGLGAILKFGPESHFSQGHSLSPNLYALADGKLVGFLPDDSAQRLLAENIQRRRAAMDYDQQTECLYALHKRENVDLFVGKYSLFERKDGTQFSICVWSNGIDSLLPKADTIAFVVDPTNEQNPDRVMVPWQNAFPVIRELMEEQPDLAPVRYRARKFPDSAQLAELRKLARDATLT